MRSRKEDALFASIASDLQLRGYSVRPAALSKKLGNRLSRHLVGTNSPRFDRAGIGRKRDLKLDDTVRRDEISWITRESSAGRDWLDWTDRLQISLNRQLFLGLFSFESHFAHYATGGFYARHSDAFKGEANRVLSIVVYLNGSWQKGDGGELVLYTGDEQNICVDPRLGTIVIFLSEQFPHEVLLTHRDRYSIAGWFRINAPSFG